MHSPRSRSAPSKRPRASLQRKVPYPPLGRTVPSSSEDTTARVRKERKGRRRACDHCKAARRRCTLPLHSPEPPTDIVAEDISPSEETPPACEQCTAARRECKYDGESNLSNPIGSAEGWTEWRSEGKIIELDDRLGLLEQAVLAKLEQVDRPLELVHGLRGAPFSLVASSSTSSSCEEDQDGVRRIQDGVRRLSVEQEEPEHSVSLDPREVLIAETNERRLEQALGMFELGGLHEPVAPAPGAWSSMGAEEGRRETMAMAMELKELVDGLVGSQVGDIGGSTSNSATTTTSYTSASSIHSDLFHWREDVDCPFRSFGAEPSFPSSPHSPSTSWTDSSSPNTPHSPYIPFQHDSPQQFARSPNGETWGSPIQSGKLRMMDDEMAVCEKNGTSGGSWGEKKLFGRQQAPLFAPRGRARTLDEAFRPTPPPPHHFDYTVYHSDTSHLFPHSTQPSLGLWDASPSHPLHSLGASFNPFALSSSPTAPSAGPQTSFPPTRAHSLDSIPSTPPPFDATLLDSLIAAGRAAPPPPSRGVKHGHGQHQSWDGRYDERLWESERGGSGLAGFAGGEAGEEGREGGRSVKGAVDGGILGNWAAVGGE